MFLYYFIGTYQSIDFFNKTSSIEYCILNINFDPHITENIVYSSKSTKIHNFLPFNEIFENVFNKLCQNLIENFALESKIAIDDLNFIYSNFKQDTKNLIVHKPNLKKSNFESDIFIDEFFQNQIFNLLKNFIIEFFNIFSCCIFQLNENKKLFIFYKKLLENKSVIDLVNKYANSKTIKIFCYATEDKYIKCLEFFIILKFAILTEERYVLQLKDLIYELIIEILKSERESCELVFVCEIKEKHKFKICILEKILKKDNDLLVYYENQTFVTLTQIIQMKCVFKKLYDDVFFSNLTSILIGNIKQNLKTIINIDLNIYKHIAFIIIKLYDESKTVDINLFDQLIKKEFSAFFDNIYLYETQRKFFISKIFCEYEKIMKEFKNNYKNVFYQNKCTIKIAARINFIRSRTISKETKQNIKEKFTGKIEDWDIILESINSVYDDLILQILFVIHFEDKEFFWKTEVLEINENNDCNEISKENVLKYFSEQKIELKTRKKISKNQNDNKIIKTEIYKIKKITKDFLLNKIKIHFRNEKDLKKSRKDSIDISGNSSSDKIYINPKNICKKKINIDLNSIENKNIDSNLNKKIINQKSEVKDEIFNNVKPKETFKSNNHFLTNNKSTIETQNLSKVSFILNQNKEIQQEKTVDEAEYIDSNNSEWKKIERKNYKKNKNFKVSDQTDLSKSSIKIEKPIPEKLCENFEIQKNSKIDLNAFNYTNLKINESKSKKDDKKDTEIEVLEQDLNISEICEHNNLKTNFSNCKNNFICDNDDFLNEKNFPKIEKKTDSKFQEITNKSTDKIKTSKKKSIKELNKSELKNFDSISIPEDENFGDKKNFLQTQDIAFTEEKTNIENSLQNSRNNFTFGNEIFKKKSKKKTVSTFKSLPVDKLETIDEKEATKNISKPKYVIENVYEGQTEFIQTGNYNPKNKLLNLFYQNFYDLPESAIYPNRINSKYDFFAINPFENTIKEENISQNKSDSNSVVDTSKNSMSDDKEQQKYIIRETPCILVEFIPIL